MERYTDEELLAMLHDLESDRAERKGSFAGDTPKRAWKVICALANEQEERILSEKRQGKDVPFDLRLVRWATVGDLSRGFFEDEYLPSAIAREILEANHRSYEERLAACKMVVSGRHYPDFLGAYGDRQKATFSHWRGLYPVFAYRRP